MRRVVITGLGMVAPTGVTVTDAWNSALQCRSGVSRIREFNTEKLPVRIAGEVREFDPTQVMNAKLARQTSRFIQFTAVATQEALRDSALDVSRAPDRCGTVIGVGLGASPDIERQTLTLHERGARHVSPLFLPYAIPNMATGFASIAHGLKGPSFSTSSACASGSHAIGEAFLHIKAGTAEVMVAGGAEGANCPLLVAAFAKMRALSTRNDAPESASRPFDRDRDGFVLGEGCGVVILEELDHARRRDAHIYAELVGYGLTADARHITQPDPEGEGVARCMAAALKNGEIALDQVEYVNAHGTSTQANDAAESAAIEMVFGEHARKLAVSSTKGVTGHCLGAAGAIEAVYTVLAVHHGVIPPTANYTNPDPACRLDYVPNQPRQRRIRHALSNSCAFGGQNACLAFRRFQ